MSAPASAPSVPEVTPAAAPGPRVRSKGYWALVWIQFKKNKLALVSLYMIAALFLLAAWAPVLANGKPWYWTENGVTTYPLIQYLVAPTETMSVEYLFNYFLFLSLTLPVMSIGVWLTMRDKDLGPIKFRNCVLVAIGGALLLALFPFLYPHSTTRTATAAELETYPGRTEITEFHLLRPWTLDNEGKNYIADYEKLDPKRGDGAAFTLLAQDPLKPSGEILNPPGTFVHLYDQNWRQYQLGVFKTEYNANIEKAYLEAEIEGVNGDEVQLKGRPGKVVAENSDVRAEAQALAGKGKVALIGTLDVLDDSPGVQLRLEHAKVLDPNMPVVRHLLGTDREGRDVLARMIHGARISMSVGFVAVGIYILLGILLGGLAGYYRGWMDLSIMRLIELMTCFPSFFLIITLVAVVDDRSIFYIMLVIGLTGWPGVARLVRGEFLKLSDQDFVQSARALGCGGTRIIFRHILPNAMGPVLVSAAFGVAGAILTESALSYLGFGAPPPTPTWGEMISQGHAHADEAWWLLFFPGFSIFLTVTVYNLAGDGLRDAMDPKMRK